MMKKLPVWLRGLGMVLLALLIGLCLRRWGVSVVSISGTSMNDTLIGGDKVLVTRFDYLAGRTPCRGDIVECRFPGRGGTYVKRIIGLPGETIEFCNGVLSVDSRPMSEPYVSSFTEDYRIKLEPGAFLALGDHRQESYDSRAEDMGPVKSNAFLGKVRWIIWPLSRFGPVNG